MHQVPRVLHPERSVCHSPAIYPIQSFLLAFGFEKALFFREPENCMIYYVALQGCKKMYWARPVSFESKKAMVERFGNMPWLHATRPGPNSSLR